LISLLKFVNLKIMKKTALIGGGLIVIGIILFAWLATPEAVVAPQDNDPQPTPESTYMNATSDDIQVMTPMPGASVMSPLTVSGKARGPWYFEASFPVEVRDEDGTLLGQGVAQAEGEWMTVEFVPFSVSVQFATPSSKKGYVLLKNDNPSGDPIRDKSISVPVLFGN
jgi:hypothetical protein